MSVKARKKPKEKNHEVQIVDGVLDIDEKSEVIPNTYQITSYGWDPQVDGLVSRLRSGNIHIPVFSSPDATTGNAVTFQREYVWKKQQADRFIESLLLGLPVPGIFLVKEEKGKHMVLDGHQRLQTLLSFYDNKWEKGPFVLEYVQDRFKGKTYDALEPSDKSQLNDSILHTTVIKQEEPDDDLSSIYLIFERLNSGGTSLQPQEIRVALYHGRFVQLLNSLNTYKSWRVLFAQKSKRLKDMELILRFFALLESNKYTSPMKAFLNGYLAKRRDSIPELEAQFRQLFEKTTDAILDGIGQKAFRPKRTVNVALVDALMVGVARRIMASGDITNPKMLKDAYSDLLEDEGFQAAITRATADEGNVRQRLELATALIAKVG